MRIQKSGKTTDLFAEELKKKMAQMELTLPEDRLEEQREEKDYEPPKLSPEGYLGTDERANGNAVVHAIAAAHFTHAGFQNIQEFVLDAFMYENPVWADASLTGIQELHQ